MVAIASADNTTDPEIESLLHTPQPRELKRLNYHTTAQHAPGDAFAMSDHEFSSSWRFHVLQIVLISSIVVYMGAYMLFPATFVQFGLLDRLADWWTESPTPPTGEPIKHLDMGRPTFLILFGVVPFAIGTLALEAMRGPQNLHRVVSRQVLQLGVVLRRKPSISIPYLCTFSTGELVFFAFLVVGNFILFVVGWICMRHYYPLPGEEYTIYTTLQLLGVVLGFSCVYNMAFLFLPATRNSAWMEFMGISYANGMKFHRWLGIATLVTAVGHALPFYPIWYHNGQLWDQAMPCFDCSLDYFSKGYPAWFNVFGEISLFFMLILAITSLPWIRRNMYETFYYAHYAFVPAVLFAVLHWNLIAWWLLPTFTIYLVDRVVGSTNASKAVTIEECTALGDGILKVVVKRSTERCGGFEVGQFVYMNVPAISTWQWHAFTIGSSPRANSKSFTIWLKSLGDWTNDLIQYTHECEQKREQPTMYIDGYYGASLEPYDLYATLCLVGGGIGATPLFAMLEDIAARVTHTSSWTHTRRIHFVFSFRELALLEEVHPVLQTLRTCHQTRDLFSFELYLTRIPREEKLSQHLAHHLPAMEKPDVSKPKRQYTCPFAEPLRGNTSRATLYALVLTASAALIAYLDYNGGVFMEHGAKSQYWPLQNFVDCMVLFVVPLVAYLFVMAESVLYHLNQNCSASGEMEDISFLAVRPSPTTTDLVTYRDLIAEYNVVIGQRPDMRKTISKVHLDLMANQNELLEVDALAKTVGVFVSGPEALKRATEAAVASVDARCFDIHDEEFEL